ncbi:hypothetical protein KIPB_016066, partial [Kipferlia bialata]
HHAYLYDVDTDEWTKDIRPSPLIAPPIRLHVADDSDPYPYRHSVVHDTLHVFRPFTRQHLTYSIRHGWATQDMMPEIGEIFSVQTFDRLLCLMCRGGTYLYDTVSGDWARVREAPEVPEENVHERDTGGQRAPVVGYAPVGHNMLLEVPWNLENTRAEWEESEGEESEGEESEGGESEGGESEGGESEGEHAMESGGGYTLSYYTVHESLLYPNEQMG